MLSEEREKRIAEGHVEELPITEIEGFYHDLDLHSNIEEDESTNNNTK